ncbi:cytochrome c oxidase subunit 7C, mitochondrial [Nilaparvata lugens]|uniref:cytochrome c oxidase subunit 7C, mitochondrial n=1 Tax=Nilaparvata lugens TaxID=108931 RepID=UPI00193E10AE|nr:cytochrome c oxidase subunit 7C, mitochondrial [Nilaparvata lugens]
MSRFTNFLSYFRRGINTSSTRRAGSECHPSNGGVIGENLPFDIYNETKFNILMTIYLMTGFGLVPLVVHHQLRKQNRVDDESKDEGKVEDIDDPDGD